MYNWTDRHVRPEHKVQLNRLIYSPIDRRPRLQWPNGARVALWLVPNVEHYEYLPRQGQMRDPWPRTPHPDVLGYSRAEYGNRIGIWRTFEVIDRYRMPCTVSLNLAVYERFPEIMQACEARKWEVLCHGIYNTDYLWGLPENEERAIIADCVATHRRLWAGSRPPARGHSTHPTSWRRPVSDTSATLASTISLFRWRHARAA